MKIVQVEYIGSYHREDLCPKDGLPEFAFIGRSNVGQIVAHQQPHPPQGFGQGIQRTGKTQSLNYYLVDQNWYIVDLPGYGYARTLTIQPWKLDQDDPLLPQNRQTLVTAFVLLDSRHTLQKIDRIYGMVCHEWRAVLYHLHQGW